VLTNIGQVGHLGSIEKGPSGSSPGFPGKVYQADASDISTLFQDSAGTTPVTSNGDPVGRFVDSVGDIALLQSTAGRRPTYQTNILNGLPGINFGGTNDVMFVNAAPLGSDPIAFTIYLVVTPSAKSDAGMFTLGSGRDPGDFSVYHSTDQWFSVWWDNSVIARRYNQPYNQTSPANKLLVISGASDVTPETLVTRENGSAFTTFSYQNQTTALGGFGSDRFVLGARDASSESSGIGGYYKGHIHELIMCNEEHDATTRGNAETELATKWGISI